MRGIYYQQNKKNRRARVSKNEHRAFREPPGW